MATFKTRWLLPMLLLNLPKCLASGRCPDPPSTLHCYIPCDESYFFGDVYCSWEHMQNSQIPTNYSLHWRSTHNNEEQGITRTSFSGLILRDHFSDPAKLFVWVQAKNQHCSAKSNVLIFNTTDIIKPPPPKFSELSDDEAFEIHWTSFCDQLMKFVGFCDVRYRTDVDQTWIEKKGFYSSYTIESPENCTAYELQVRCACKTSLASNWSTSRRIPGLETVTCKGDADENIFFLHVSPLNGVYVNLASMCEVIVCSQCVLWCCNQPQTPIGKLDIWMDCGIATKASDCFLTWKELPISQTCGVILGYELRLSHGDNTKVLVNLSTSLPNSQLECHEMQCHFKSSVKNAASVSLSAYNVHGANTPSYLPKFVTGKGETQQVLHFEMNEENLTVSWDVPPLLSDTLKKYVVQYKQVASPPGQEFNWVKLNKSQRTTFIRGQFKKCTPYRISLFAILHGNEVHHLSSAIGYSQQGAPLRIPSFKVLEISATGVILNWEPIPLSMQEGFILYYQIGGNHEENVVYNVSEQTQMALQHLSPGQDYEVWIRAVTAVGPGKKNTLRFKTKHHEDFGFWRVLVFVCFFFFCLFVITCMLARKKKISLLSGCYCEKIPDPKNSHIFREAKNQICDPMTWICSPYRESLPKIIMLEVVLIQPSLEKNKSPEQLNTPIVGEWSSSTECEEDQREEAITEVHQRTEEYKKIVDSDEERSWSSSEREPYTSGYEKHFMPTAVDVLEYS